jgi:hypothetical protein
VFLRRKVPGRWNIGDFIRSKNSHRDAAKNISN